VETQTNFSIPVVRRQATTVREGSPTTEMPLTRIESIQEYRNWLIVRGGEPTQQITIPVEVEGFQELKRKLATYGTVSPLKTKSSPLWLLQLAVATVAYVLLLTSHVVSVVIVAGCLALLLQRLGFYSLRRAYRGRLMKLLLMGTYLFSCLIIVWLVYERTRGIT
jgi:hypothetical protein